MTSIGGGSPVVHGRPRLGRRLVHAFTSADSYGFVLLLILVSYIVAISLEQSWALSLVLAVQMVTVWVSFRTSHARRVPLLIAGVLLAISAVVAVAHLIVPDSDHVGTTTWVVASLLYFIAPLSILRHLVSRQVVDLETVLGAIDAYLLIGMFFALVFQSLSHLQSGPFFGTEGEGTFPQDLFFSFTTLTTTGYGNLVPAANPGQTFAVAEMLIGQLFLVSAVAKVVNARTPKRNTAAAGEDASAAGAGADASAAAAGAAGASAAAGPDAPSSPATDG